MKNKSLRFITFILAFIMLFTSSTELLAMSFKDTNDSWAKTYISWCSDNGIISGYTDGSFKPNKKITRAEFATMLAKSIKKEASSIVDINYEDVKPKDWFYAPVRKLVSFGILSNEGKFYPNKLITRELAIKWLASTIDYKTKLSLINNYSDEKDIVNKEAFEKLLELNILSGYPNNTLKPKNLITRAEAAKLFYTYMSIVNEKGILLDILKNDIDTDKSDKNEDKDKKSDADNKINYPEIPYRPHRPTDDWDNNKDDNKPAVPKKRFTLNIKSTDDYTVEITPASIDGKYEEGQVINVKISLKNDKKQIKQVLINGNNIASVNGTYSFIMPSEESSLDVVLENKPIEQKDDLTIDFEDEDEEVKIKRNTKIKFKADTKDPEAKEINLRLNRESDTHLIYLNTYPIDSKTSSINDIDFVVPDHLEPGRYILSVKSGKPQSKMQTKIIVVEDQFESIESIDSVEDIKVTQGDDIVIPQYINAKFSDGSTRSVKINWDLPDSFENAGEYIIEGSIDGYDQTIKIKVIVNKKRAKLSSILPIKDMTIVKGAKIDPPKNIKVKMDDGSIEDRTAHWNEINFTSDKIGNYSIDGYILTDEADLNSKKLPIKINIIVKDSEPFEAHFAIVKDYKEFYLLENGVMIGSKESSKTGFFPGKDLDYSLVIKLKNSESKLESVEFYSDQLGDNLSTRNESVTSRDKRLFYIKDIGEINTKIIANITIDGEQYTKTIDFVVGNDFQKEAVAIKDDLNFTYPQGKLNLPDSVVALYNDGTEGKSNITWDLTNVDKDKVGTYDITGTLASGLVVKAKLNIIEYKDIKLSFNQPGTVTLKQNEYIMPDNELTLSISGIKNDEIKSINIVSDNEKVVKIESHDKKTDGSDIKIKAKAVGIGNATITCNLETTNGQKATQKLNVVVNPIREFKADEFVVIAKDGGKISGTDASKFKIVSIHEDIELYGKIDNISFNTVKINTDEEGDAYKKYSSLIGTKVSISVYLERYGSTPQAKLDGVKVIKEGDPFPWQEVKPEFKAEDFSLACDYDEYAYGFITKLTCTNPDANKIKSFGLYKEDGNSAFMESVVSYEDGGFTTVELNHGEYTLKVFADEKGQDLLYEGPIIFKSEETNDGFKAEDFSLACDYDEYVYGFITKLTCTNPDANKIKSFGLYKEDGNSAFLEEVVSYEDGGYTPTELSSGEYTLKVFADDKGQDLLYEGPIKFIK